MIASESPRGRLASVPDASRKARRREYLREYLRWLWPYRYAVAFVFFLALLSGAFAIALRSRSNGGAALIAGACIAWGIDNNLTRKLSSADPVQIAMIKGLVAGSVNLVLAFAGGAT